MRSAVCFCISAQWISSTSDKLWFLLGSWSSWTDADCRQSIFVDFRSISNLCVFSAKGSSTAGLIYDASRGPLAGQTESPRSDQMRNACRYGPMQHTHTDTHHTHRHSHTHTHTHPQTQTQTHTTQNTHTHHCHKSAIFFSQLWLFPAVLTFWVLIILRLRFTAANTSSFCLSAVIVTQNHWTCKTISRGTSNELQLPFITSSQLLKSKPVLISANTW